MNIPNILCTYIKIPPLSNEAILCLIDGYIQVELPKTDLKHGLIGFSVVLICLTFGKIRLNHVSDPFWGALYTRVKLN